MNVPATRTDLIECSEGVEYFTISWNSIEGRPVGSALLAFLGWLPGDVAGLLAMTTAQILVQALRPSG
jgi:hypothetical protein